ncbi:hypothetical protein IHN63_00635 [Deinococcus sp. 6YEL10]|uniref:hypothetical protein n=1 Tax=Deinococcus sp. 6YEL10 TaxID=2745870 RepID=UPI001E5E8F46|nr:hypothetical protein [Deinococcus sp. 6YEL10]MCD0159806.1 hypothetical protein [Deinococcus sp. 6YEL10]
MIASTALFPALHQRLFALFFCDFDMLSCTLNLGGAQPLVVIDARSERGTPFQVTAAFDREALDAGIMTLVSGTERMEVTCEGRMMLPETAAGRIEFIQWWRREFPEASSVVVNLIRSEIGPDPDLEPDPVSVDLILD